MTVFDTETMAELCVKQGLYERATEIYRRLAAETDDSAARERYQARIAALSGRRPEPAGGATTSPATAAGPASSGLRVDLRGDELEIEWRLPHGTAAPTLQCLLLRRTPGGIEAEPRTVALGAPEGQMKLVIPNLHSARVAAGRLEGATFVPLARLPLPL